MPVWLQVLLAIILTIQIPFGAWVALEIMKLRGHLAALRERVTSREHECADRLNWLRGIDTKIDKLIASVATISGYLKGKDKGQ